MLLSLALLACQSTPAPAPAAEAPALPPARIAVVGASASRGWGLSLELEVDSSISPFLDAALTLPHEELLNLSDGLMFMNPEGTGREQLEAALAFEPTLLIAADYAFWFGYGGFNSPLEERLDRLDRGLKRLESFECPVLIGDFPDMSPAAAGSSPLRAGKPIIDARQIPSPEHLVALNERLRSWAKGRANIHLFPMSSFAERLRDAQPLKLRAGEVAAADKPGLLQEDLLHPTVKGTAVFTLLLLDQLVQDGVLSEQDVEWDLTKVEAAAWEATRAERDKLRRRRERREERKRELEERKRAREQRNGEQRDAA